MQVCTIILVIFAQVLLNTFSERPVNQHREASVIVKTNTTEYWYVKFMLSGIRIFFLGPVKVQSFAFSRFNTSVYTAESSGLQSPLLSVISLYNV